MNTMCLGGRGAGMSTVSLYHALDLASIEALDCDIPLNLGFDIQRYIKEEERTHLRYGLTWRGRLKRVPRLADNQDKMNRHPVSMAPRHINSNSGAGYR